MKKILLLYIAISLFGCSFSNETRQDAAVSLETLTVLEGSTPTIKSTVYTSVENLRLRAEPTLSSKVILTLKKNTPLTYLEEKSKQIDSIKIGEKIIISPWYKVKMVDKELSGWVFGGGIIVKKNKLVVINSSKSKEDRTQTELAKKYLNKILENGNLQGKYKLSYQLTPHFLIGNFNTDSIEDIAIFIKENKKSNPKAGLIIGSPSVSNIKPVVFGAGEKYFESHEYEDYSDIGIFEKIDTGNDLIPNWNEEIDDFYYENDIIPKEKIVTITSDAIFIHAAEACGGGFIYWKNNKYNWMQNE